MAIVNKTHIKKIIEDAGFMCFDCAHSLGGTGPHWPVTCHKDKCPVCDEKKTLAAVHDFDWPALNKKAIWD